LFTEPLLSNALAIHVTILYKLQQLFGVQYFKWFTDNGEEVVVNYFKYFTWKNKKETKQEAEAVLTENRTTCLHDTSEKFRHLSQLAR
jgi:hypothetical protein